MVSEVDGRKLIKLLSPSNTATFQGSLWHVPEDGKKAKKMPKIRGKIQHCHRGYHVTTFEGAMITWMQQLDDVFWYVEVGDDLTENDYKFVSSTARILGIVPEDELPTPVITARKLYEDIAMDVITSLNENPVEQFSYNRTYDVADQYTMDSADLSSSYARQYSGTSSYNLYMYGQVFVVLARQESNLARKILRSTQQPPTFTSEYNIARAILFAAGCRLRCSILGLDEAIEYGTALDDVINGIKTGTLFRYYNRVKKEVF